MVAESEGPRLSLAQLQEWQTLNLRGPPDPREDLGST